VASVVASEADITGGRRVFWCKLDNLEDAALYEYQVRMLPPALSASFVDATDEQAVSKVPPHVFRHTPLVPADASPDGDPLTLAQRHEESAADVVAVVVGDSQSGAAMFRHHVEHMSAHSPDFMIHTGDTVQNAREPREWHAYLFGPLEGNAVGAKVPLVLARGNHDGPESGRYSDYAPLPPFALSVGCVRLIVLDGEMDTAAQENWLRLQLESRQAKAAAFLVVVTHIPPFVEFWEPEAWNARGEKHWGRFVRDKYVPMFEAAGVDLVIAGHSHLYQRGERNGVNYLVVGGGGGDLEATRVEDYHMYAVTKLVHHYGVLRTEAGCALEWRAFDKNDEAIDSLRLIKC